MTTWHTNFHLCDNFWGQYFREELFIRLLEFFIREYILSFLESILNFRFLFV